MEKLYISLAVIAAVLLVVLFCLFSNNALQITRYKVGLSGVKEGLKIVHLSDLHGKSFKRNNEYLLKKIAEEKPDIIAITGDIIHRYTPRDKDVALKLVSALSGIAPTLFVAGNHEMRNKGYRFFRRSLMSSGAVVLDDCSVDICGLTVTGLNGASLRNDKIFKIAKGGESSVLLAHEPQFIDKYARAGYALVLCGHAHGGQWRIPFAKKGLYAPGQGLLPKYASGLHEKDGCKMIISRGLGNSRFPLRLFNRPEIVAIELTPSDPNLRKQEPDNADARLRERG